MNNEQEALETFAVQHMALVDAQTVAVTAMGPSTKDGPGVFESSRILSYSLANNNWGWLEYPFGAWWRTAGGTTSEGQRRALFGAGQRIAGLTYGDGENGNDPKPVDKPATVSDMAWIEGHFYACGGNEFLGRRTAPGAWDYLSLADSPKTARFSFFRMAGVSADNIYCIQDDVPYSVWHWNGRALTRLPYPTEIEEGVEDAFFTPGAMVAAPNGQVFIGGERGELLMGSAEADFVALHHPDATEGKRGPKLQGLAWYQDSLWAVDGARLLRLVDGEWEAQPFLEDEERPMGFKFIDAKDGALLVGSQYRAALFDGEKWHRIFGSGDPDQWLRLKLLQQQHDDMAELLESARALRDQMRGTNP